MDPAICHVIYVDRRVHQDRVIRSSTSQTDQTSSWESPDLAENVSLLLGVFGDVHLCATGAACVSQLLELQNVSMIDLKPTIVLIDTPHDERIPEERSRSRSPSPHSIPPSETDDVQVYPDGDAYGLQLLQRIVSETHTRNLSKLVVPIPIVSFSSTPEAVEGGASSPDSGTGTPSRRLLKRCLDLGAVDVMISPMHTKNVTALEVHAYQAHKAAAKDQQALLELRRGRKRSWVGITDDRPFAYLREAMVSTLMKRICQMGGDTEDRMVDAVKISVPSDRKSSIATAIGNWYFCAHDFSDDELIAASALMFKHAFTMPELESWRIPTDQLTCFLIACRAAYNTFVPYHNFRHVVDVLQATFHFLLRIGALPPYPSRSAQPGSDAPPPPPKSPMASLIHPFEALTLLITAIGHDVGHPGVNNGFLVVLNAPLAQLYNDRSVLESFHCAAYSQILRRYWPAAFNNTKMRNLMISSILATDMGLHFDYMKKLSETQEKLKANNSTEGWNDRTVEEQKALACALLIKCADISNVARRHDTALQWMHILSDEFSRQASMENELEIASSLMAPPKKDVISLSKAQLGFMDLFAIPLFEGVAEIMPPLRYTVDELAVNKGLFNGSITDEQVKQGISPPSEQSRGATATPTEKRPEVDGESPAGNGNCDSVIITEEISTSCAVFAAEAANPTAKPSHIPAMVDEYKEVNGMGAQYDTVADFAASDPFNIHEARQFASSKQRCSEATDGSASMPGTGDWASQATSATTGKMPLSPSTQGTSIISRDSLERPSSVPVTTITAPDSSKSQSDPTIESHPLPEDESSLSSSGRSPDNKGLKKKTSRFRLKFFRRHKDNAPPMPTADSHA